MIKVPMNGLIKDNAEVGAGDVVKHLADALHIQFESCGCKSRQQWLNDRVRFAGRKTLLRRDGKS